MIYEGEGRPATLTFIVWPLRGPIRRPLRGLPLTLIIKDAPKYKPFNEEILRNLKSVEKDNNFIYHEVVPAENKLDSVKPAIVAKQINHERNKILIENTQNDIFEAVVPLQGQLF